MPPGRRACHWMLHSTMESKQWQARPETAARCRWRMVGWSIPALLLLVPLVATQFTAAVDWAASDLLFAGPA